MNLEVKVLSNLRHLTRLIKTPSTRSQELRRPSPISLLLSKENEKTKRHDGRFLSNNIRSFGILVIKKTVNFVVSRYASVHVLSRSSMCKISQQCLLLPGVVVEC